MLIHCGGNSKSSSRVSGQWVARFTVLVMNSLHLADIKFNYMTIGYLQYINATVVPFVISCCPGQYCSS